MSAPSQPTKTLRILHAPSSVGGQPQNLSRAEKLLGQESHAMTLAQNFLRYQTDSTIFTSGSSLLRNELRRWVAIVKALWRYDVFHYNFGASLAPMRYHAPTGRYGTLQAWLYNNLYARWVELLDVKLAKWLGKAVMVTYQGDDARQGDYCHAHYTIHPCHEEGIGYYTAAHDALKRERIAVFDRYADVIYALNPDLLHVLPARTKFMPYASVDINDWRYIEKPAEPEIVHVVHSPTNRIFKGTQYLLAAFARLEAEGIPFRYTLVEGLPNAEARNIYETADLLVDQLLVGYYGGLAVELMSLGTPVICHLKPEDFTYMPEKMREEMPLIHADPDTIYDVLKLWLTERKGELRSLGKRSRQYVETWHDPMKIAAMHIADYHAAIDRKREA